MGGLQNRLTLFHMPAYAIPNVWPDFLIRRALQKQNLT